MRALFAALLLAAVGCTTTTTTGRTSEAAYSWLQRRVSSNVVVIPEVGGPMRGVVIEAPSPTEVRLVTPQALIVPPEQVRQVVEVHRGLGALEGAGIGLAAGAIFGALYGATRPLSRYEGSMDCTIVCDNGDAAMLAAIQFAVLGVLLGTPTGAIIGDRDLLDLR